MELDDHENDMRDILSAVACREDWQEAETEWLDKFEEIYCCYYITPIHQVVVYWSEALNDYDSVSLWNMRK